jgi:hypothetical protein
VPIDQVLDVALDVLDVLLDVARERLGLPLDGVGQIIGEIVHPVLRRGRCRGQHRDRQSPAHMYEDASH